MRTKIQIWGTDGQLIANAIWLLEAFLLYPNCDRSRQQYIQILNTEKTAFLQAKRENGKAIYTPSSLLRTLDAKWNRGFQGHFYTSLMVHAFHIMDLHNDENPSQRKAAAVAERAMQNFQNKGGCVNRKINFPTMTDNETHQYDFKSKQTEIRARWREHLPVAHLWAAIFSMNHDVLSEPTPFLAYPDELTRHLVNHAIGYQKILECVLDPVDAQKLFDLTNDGFDPTTDFTFDECFMRKMCIQAYAQIEIEGMMSTLKREQNKLKNYARKHGISLDE